MNNYSKTSHSTYNNLWHFEWCTKYRYKMFKQDKYRTFCYIAITEGAKRYNIEILELNVQPDHLHIVASLQRGMNDIKALHLLKGYMAKLLFIFDVHILFWILLVKILCLYHAKKKNFIQF